MLGTFVNAAAIVAGGGIGLVLRGGIPSRYSTTVMQALSLAVMLIGVTNALKTQQILLVIICLAAGSVLGEWLRIEERLEGVGNWVQSRFAARGEGFSRGFVTTSLIYCVGALAIVGSLESGLAGDHRTLFAKSLLDGIASIVFASTMGSGVLLSSVSVFVYQGAITLSASFVSRSLTPEVIAEMSAVGGLLIAAIGFNMLEVKRIRVGNMLPAIFLPLLYFALQPLVPFP
ncbi:MAG TPA: DUF554 domain-containing protein [Desulfobacteraceae bacterium]|nr:DUF554 domain-containing protein [Desulfobacteraceae bacterium]